MSAETSIDRQRDPRAISIFMCGDVMLGRGIDQVLPHPGNPVIHEQSMKSAKGYIEIAEQANGPFPYPVSWPYIWGDALAELDRLSPDLRIINLETSVTKSNNPWKGKGINYRMNPENIACLTAAKIDFCALANNHVLDWGRSGLVETLETLNRARVKSAGAGRNIAEAEKPAIMEVKGKGRVIIFSYGVRTSGIPPSWAATDEQPGINFLEDLSDRSLNSIKEKVAESKEPGDIALISIHWGGNWGYEIPPQQIKFAHRLIDEAGVDLIHGHSSHHVQGVEVYKDRLIIHGSGDFLNDYEGISINKSFRDDLGLMYNVTVAPVSGKLLHLQMIPTRIKHFRVNRAAKADILWLRDILNREGKKYGSRVKLNRDRSFTLEWG
ncbi:CapA family protein [Desulfotalea psychrophila]|uniref:Capsule synthesis protein CapA domain-containing protein n=1 Tax=Desulfotalea psychrophila (strain LSv54 / DSM 12343) TaxID=177439 RepID=Q6AKV0_DESPS|nr:CapA family protein [Desulfotalea psychrophila]CAG37025.1 conserved hypothetical protein [Desulfotalea psychrophila LSv54]